MSDYRLIPVYLVVFGVLASVFVLPNAQDMSVMRDADAKRFGVSQQAPINLKLASL